jgi:hypothetical protein
MSLDRQQQIEELYNAALERAEGERASFLAQACAGDEKLRRELESLLGATIDDGSTSQNGIGRKGSIRSTRMRSRPAPLRPTAHRKGKSAARIEGGKLHDGVFHFLVSSVLRCLPLKRRLAGESCLVSEFPLDSQ